jgi:hypothetical protein
VNFDHLLSKTYQPGYTCYEFACEAWQHIADENLTERMQDFLNGTGTFVPIDTPESPCIAFYYRNDNSPTHVGLFIDGRILHLGFRGAQYAPLDLLMTTFKEVRFYK